MNILAGKRISLLGASTSTFDGYSNSALYNTTLPVNHPYYPREYLPDVHDTWWMRVIDTLQLELCVNNAWSGSCVTTLVDGDDKAGCMMRATQLHNDVTQAEPDIIVLIIGGNDALRGYEIGSYSGVSDIYDSARGAYIGDCTLFGDAYATMVHKVKARYPHADICVCSMLHWPTPRHDKGLVIYNDVIRKIAEEFGVTYVDFYNRTDICPETAETFLHTDGIHPNRLGFEQMADCLVKVLRDQYAQKANKES
ncbi:MAG: SGNH/GDSL hydrolase family protein [Clostridia bacterium]|nr:SGNH/GDSL hydrolase family protein [Clostridia bacterium]